MDRAVGLAANLLRDHEHAIETLQILPSKGGVFEVTIDGALVYSKKKTGRHAEPGEVEEAVGKLIG